MKRSLVVLACSSVALLTAIVWRCSPAAAPDQDNAQAKIRHELRAILVGRNHETFRVRVNSGESWFVRDGNRFEKIPDTEPIPAGEYDIIAVSNHGTEWVVYRIDHLSGAAWILAKNKWEKIKEPN